MAIRIIDLEITGIDPTAHVVEVGSVDLLPDGSIGRFQEYLIKPPFPIPAEARAVHHISDEDIAQAKPWNTVSSTFFDRGNCLDLVAFAAHNAAFDQQWLPPDLLSNLPLICTYKAAVHIWPEAPKHSNQVLRYWLGLNMDRSIADRAHRALPDAYVTANLLREILKHASIEDLIRWTNEPVLARRRRRCRASTTMRKQKNHPNATFCAAQRSTRCIMRVRSFQIAVNHKLWFYLG